MFTSIAKRWHLSLFEDTKGVIKGVIKSSNLKRSRQYNDQKTTWPTKWSTNTLHNTKDWNMRTPQKLKMKGKHFLLHWWHQLILYFHPAHTFWHIYWPVIDCIDCIIYIYIYIYIYKMPGDITCISH